MTSGLWPKELNKLCPDCEHLFPPSGPWPWDGGTIGKFKRDVREPSVEELDASATSTGCHLCRALLECILPGSMKFNRHDYPTWFELNKEFRYSVSLYDARHDSNQHLRSVSLGLTATGERRWMGVQVRWLTLYRARPVLSDGCSETPNVRRGRWIFKEVDPPAHSEEIEDAGLMDVDVVQPTSATTFDPLAFAQLRRWVDECTQKHELCKIAPSGQNSIFGGFQQTVRLVDVGLDDSSPIRLVEHFRVDQVRYNTLSYQWTADTSKASLKKHNKAAYCHAIPTEAWPKVYKDVVIVCRSLGVRYVWIDSLCIVQDDLEDWEVQSSMMQDIYSHGYLNLANVLGKHADGLEVSRDPTATSPCILSRTLADGSTEHWGCIEDGNWREQIQDAPLYTRGWCYQERFLSARTVQFGPQLYWECREQFASESVPSSKAFYDIKHPDLITTSAKEKESAGGTLSPAEIWETVVKIYTTTQLTQQSDKLVALRGVFNRFWERFEAEAEAARQQESSQQGQQHQHNIDWCIAGLWKRDLIRQLLWRRETYHVDSIPNPERWPEEDATEQKSFNARATEVLKLYPSWSWAACPSYLGFGVCFTTQPTDRVEDMVVIEKIVPGGTSTDYTAFDSSALVLRGLLYDGINAIDLSQVFFDWRSKSESSGTVKHKHHAQLIRRSAWWIYFDRPLQLTTPLLRPENVGVLMVRLVGLGEVRQTRWMHGLLVEKLGTGTVGEDDGLPLPTYRRMGFFLLRSKRGLIPGVEWPERFGTREEAEEAVREVRERRGRFPLLRLV
ncbi:heterokaryon incompatibility protein-domain-containing protein [Neurospora tetraspora]|uniref:Heterokaryon incompatibility protein-domain-containing protein n=1 Tax=Neurospora tetraspora TaxID=94610 RepID=A0AAE0MSE3_9PEZI|nr:heterokaryon incompatibility protein-domain-containing protein [Neurospora tetraspora]